MPAYSFQLAAGVDPTNVNLPDRIASYFAGKGYTVIDGAWVTSDGLVTVTLDRDPSADAAAFANQPTPAEQAQAAAITYLKTVYLPLVQAIPNASRTPEQRALLAITTILKAQLTP